MVEYTEKEKVVLTLMFQNFDNMMRTIEDYSKLGGYIEGFSANDLYTLSRKLDVDY